jgi:tetratricopeptide (TPR) repeat protein
LAPQRAKEDTAIAYNAPGLNLRTLNPIETIQDRFLFMSSVAWCIFLGDYASGFLAARGVRARMAAAALALGYFACLWRAEHLWHDELTYFRTCVANYPQSWVCRTNLGLELWHTGDLKSAERQLEAAARIRPHDGIILGDLASLHVKMDKLDRAKDEFTREIEVWKDAPVAVYVELAEVTANWATARSASRCWNAPRQCQGGA